MNAKEREMPATAVEKKTKARPRGRPAADIALYRNGSVRDQLVRTGKAMLEQMSLADLSLRGIAAAVGVSQVAPKHHFGNKEGLLAAIAASGFRDLTEFRFSRLRPQMNAEQRFRTLLTSYVQFAIEKPALFHLMFAPEFKTPQLHAELNEAASHSFHVVARAAAEFLAEGVPGGTAISGEEAARIAWMSMHGVATLLIEHRINPLGAPKVTREQLVNQMLDVVFAGLGALRRRA
jgi:AcrR family transcriptional regulator